MNFLTAILFVFGVAAVFASSEHDSPNELGDDVLDDDVSFFQSQVLEKSKKKPDEADAEPVNGYKLADSLDCASEKPAPKLTELDSVAKEPAAVAVNTSTSSDPPGADAFRALLQLMFALIIADGIRRWYLQKEVPQKFEDADNSQAAWVDMVNAAKSGNSKRFDVALRGKAPVTQADAWGCTPLHFAAMGGSVDIVSKLLAAADGWLAVDIDALDANNEMPLHYAARAGYAGICELLLDAGAKADGTNMQGMTPLLIAGHANAEAACRVLADRHAGVSGLADEDLPPLVVSQVVQKVFAEGFSFLPQLGEE